MAATSRWVLVKILTIAGWMYPDQEGGSFRVVYEAGRRLAARGHEVHVVTQKLDERHPESERLAGMMIHRYRTAAQSGLRFYASTLREVPRLVDRLHREVGFDVLHMHHPVSALAANRARATQGIPRIVILHSLYFLEYIDRHTYSPDTGQPRRLGWLRWPVVRALLWMDGVNLHRADRIVVLSEFTQALARRRFPGCAARVVKLPGGADLEHFTPSPSRAEARARLGLPSEPTIFFTCRRLEHRMGIRELVEAARLLRQERRNALVLIAGRGVLETDLRRQIREAGIESAVRLLGYVPEEQLPLYYRAADCFVLATRALEGFGLVTAEAFASGIPVLGTPVGATPELIRPFDPRLVTEDATAPAIYRGMARFMDEVAVEEGLAERCRSYAEEHFSWDRFVSGLEELSRELVAGRIT
jgi:glycosyltransferase involved in cell wall biosynthesis